MSVSFVTQLNSGQRGRTDTEFAVNNGANHGDRERAVIHSRHVEDGFRTSESNGHRVDDGGYL